MNWDNFHWKHGLKEITLNDIDFSNKQALTYNFDCPMKATTIGDKRKIEFFPHFTTKDKKGNILTDIKGIAFGEMSTEDATIENTAKFMRSGVNAIFDLYSEECKKRYNGQHLYFPLPTDEYLIQSLQLQVIAKKN